MCGVRHAGERSACTSAQPNTCIRTDAHRHECAHMHVHVHAGIRLLLRRAEASITSAHSHTSRVQALAKSDAKSDTKQMNDSRLKVIVVAAEKARAS